MKKFEWTEKDLRRWEFERERGPFLWILRNGLMTWGASMFLMMTIFWSWMDGKEMVTRGELYGNAALWLVGGAVWGLAVWVLSERSYKKALKREDARPQS